ncbi:hypothetical protein JBW_04490 [Pelosinus fermentans JBW45]|uniref:Uncharacterized protein n=1 Tax=Pelosinus fermentans JBW45 TaxID=1192197 RepID=I8TZW1_9FIRM|nr:hypothetical protein JBW_04490 [Pelosinus fermentans JBW45]
MPLRFGYFLLILKDSIELKIKSESLYILIEEYYIFSAKYAKI